MNLSATDTTEVQWWDLVGRWKQYAADFEKNYQALLAQQSFVATRPALYYQWRTLVADGANTRAKIQSITQTIGSVTGAVSNAWDWLKSTVGLSGQLGFLPLIPIAVISASIAAVALWLTKARALSQQIEEAKRLEAQGVPAVKAAAMAQGYGGSAPASGIKLPFGIELSPLAIAGIAAVVIAPPLFSYLKGRNK